MLFTSPEFATFLAIVLAAYYVLAHRAQNVLLLLASYVFYGWWAWRFLGLLWGSTLVDFVVARLIDRSEGPARKRWLLVSIFVNLGFLCVFKYFNFFIDSAADLLELVGMQANLPTLRIILPVGISFFTFQSLSYTIDVYRRKIPASRNLLTYGVFVAYFPQLVNGPIERFTHMSAQFERPRRVNAQQIYSALLLLLFGFFKKLAIADTCAPFVDDAFGSAGQANWWVLLQGVFLFSLQIYCDFSGYTDIARGTSRLLGIELMENFNQPYLSMSITEFWRRWHISLSGWLRDYLYIPLGGNRHGTFNTYRNLMLTMLLGGLWHGANWTFVVWGALHGVYLSIHKWMLGERPPDPAPPPLATRVAKTLGTLAIVMFAWTFFRADSFAAAAQLLAGIFTLRGGVGAFSPWDLAFLGFLVSFVLLIDVPQYRQSNQAAWLDWPWPLRGAAIAVLFILILVMGANADVPFIYFQF